MGTGIGEFYIIALLYAVLYGIMCVTFFYSMRYNVHMFQQNSYKERVQLKWIKKYFKRQRFLLIYAGAVILLLIAYFCMTFGSEAKGLITGNEVKNSMIANEVQGSIAASELQTAVKKSVIGLFALLFVFPVLLGYTALKKIYTVKPLVYTARVKRLVTCNILSMLILDAGITCASVKFAEFMNSGFKTVGIASKGILDAAGAQFSGENLLRTLFIAISASMVLGILTLLEPWLTVFCNYLMRPVEKAVNNHYIRDAKRRLRAQKGLIVIGVTGSYGKTSVKFLLKSLLAEKYDVLATPESFNTPMGVVRTIREHLKPTNQIFVCEMGARNVGDIKEICDIVHPACGVITSVGPQHLESFKTIENVRKTKFELAEALPTAAKLFLNADSDEILKDTGNYNKIYYGINNKQGYYAENITVSARGTSFTVVAPDGEKETFNMHLLGDINVLNVVGAVAVAHEFGIRLTDLKIPVRRLTSVRHRLEMTEKEGYTLIDDAYNSNPVGANAALKTLSMFSGCRILITPGMVELGEKMHEIHFEYGRTAAAAADYILLVNKERTRDIMDGAISAGFDKERIVLFDKFSESFTYALNAIKAQEHKTILIENDLPDNY